MNPGLRLLAVDPGLRGCGAATFVDNRLERAWYCRNTERNERGPKAWREMGLALHADLVTRGLLDIHAFATEYPQIYHSEHQIGDQDDIVQLACAAGAISAVIPAKHFVGYLPRYWKGQVPKKVHNLRVVCRLDEEEKTKLEPVPQQLRNNIIDAIGIGLFLLKQQRART